MAVAARTAGRNSPSVCGPTFWPPNTLPKPWSGQVEPLPHPLYVALIRAQSAITSLAGKRFRLADWYVRHGRRKARQGGPGMVRLGDLRRGRQFSARERFAALGSERYPKRRRGRAAVTARTRPNQQTPVRKRVKRIFNVYKDSPSPQRDVSYNFRCLVIH